MHRCAGLQLRDRDEAGLALWIADRVRTLGLPTTDAYANLLDAHNAAGRLERELLTSHLTTGETYFFRDHGQFHLLANRILPELIERGASARRLRLWSAGCASGEEAYSLAMLVLEHQPATSGWDVQILGTDINSGALARARAGLYTEWSFRGLDEQRRRAYFRRDGRHWQIDARLRRMVRFESADLVKDAFPDPSRGIDAQDLIVCRNVFIYLSAESVRAITAKFAATLGTGGYLVTGHAELLGHNTPGLHTRVFAESVVLQKASEADVAALGSHLNDAAAPLPQKAAALPPAAAARAAVAAPAVSRPAARPQAAAPAPRANATPKESVGDLMRQAWREADRGSSAQAERTCRRVIDLAPFDPWPYYLLAQLAQERGDAKQARAMLDKVIYLDPAFAPAYLELASLLEHEGQPERARQLLLTARGELLALPADATVAPYGQSRVGEMLAYVEHLLEGGESPAAATAASQDSAPGA